MVVGHSDDNKKTRVRLPSGTRKTIPSTCRAIVGIVAGGGRMDKPVLKAGNNFHKYRVKRNSWPKAPPPPGRAPLPPRRGPPPRRSWLPSSPSWPSRCAGVGGELFSPIRAVRGPSSFYSGRGSLSPRRPKKVREGRGEGAATGRPWEGRGGCCRGSTASLPAARLPAWPPRACGVAPRTSAVTRAVRGRALALRKGVTEPPCQAPSACFDSPANSRLVTQRQSRPFAQQGGDSQALFPLLAVRTDSTALLPW
ncbi:unnamed protein product [Prorocentrum cordatum]|uniref:Large ribosomal subunit protein uL2 C-terminal domain-containing protein n=1 Tax=Prorocentrum cordatum TaxID=2364126 RepID=A0ABN9W6N0_9DINO|nr:unnamed protein product [Polarella glacialis]